MKLPTGLLACSGILLVGCAVARTSYHVVTAPVRWVVPHKKSTSTTTTTSTTDSRPDSDVAAPGAPLPPPSPTPTQRTVKTEHVANPSPSPSRTVATTAPASRLVKFPTAKPVPGKPGYVYDPFNPKGGYIDVSGYAPGSKVKDPTTKQIFIVP